LEEAVWLWFCLRVRMEFQVDERRLLDIISPIEVTPSPDPEFETSGFWQIPSRLRSWMGYSRKTRE